MTRRRGKKGTRPKKKERRDKIQSPIGREKEHAEIESYPNLKAEVLGTCTEPACPTVTLSWQRVHHCYDRMVKGDKGCQDTDRKPRVEGRGDQSYLHLKLEDEGRQKPKVPEESTNNTATKFTREAKEETQEK